MNGIDTCRTEFVYSALGLGVFTFVFSAVCERYGVMTFPSKCSVVTTGVYSIRATAYILSFFLVVTDECRGLSTETFAERVSVAAWSVFAVNTTLRLYETAVYISHVGERDGESIAKTEAAVPSSMSTEGERV